MSNKYLIQSYFREPESIDRWDTIIELKRYCPDEPDFDLIVAKKLCRLLWEENQRCWNGVSGHASNPTRVYCPERYTALYEYCGGPDE